MTIGRGQQRLPREELKRRAAPVVAADVHDARRPQERGEDEGAIAQHRGAIGPVEGERVEENHQAEEPHDDAGGPPRCEPLVQEEARARRHPERRRVGEHHRAPGGDDHEADRHQHREAHHVQERDAEHDGQILPARRGDAPPPGGDREEDDGGDRRAQRHRPERRQALEDHLVHRPGEAPREHHGREQHRRPAEGHAAVRVVRRRRPKGDLAFFSILPTRRRAGRGGRRRR